MIDDSTCDHLLTYLTDQHPGDIRSVISSSKYKNHKSNPQSSTHDTKDIQPKRKINAIITYPISNIVYGTKGSLVNRRANRGLAGKDVRVICTHELPRFINVSGIDSHQLNNICEMFYN